MTSDNSNLPGMGHDEHRDSAQDRKTGNVRSNVLTTTKTIDLRDYLVANAERLARERPLDADLARQASADPAVGFTVTKSNIRTMREALAPKHRKLGYEPGGPANLDTGMQALVGLIHGVRQFAASLQDNDQVDGSVQVAATQLAEQCDALATDLELDES